MKVVVIGAGMSGLCMGIRLKRAGLPFVILEKSPQLGGTWWENTYPGCACDIPSHLYSFSFAPKADWSQVYPPQREILEYLEQLASRFGLLEHIRFGAQVREARYQEDASRWEVELESGELISTGTIVSAVGALHVPNYPQLSGRGEFAGPSFHSARWDHEVDLSGKRVGVIGNAASAVQLVPQVAKQAAELYVFQRSAHWIGWRVESAYSGAVKWLFRLRPLQRVYRWLLYFWQELLFLLLFRKGSLGARLLQRALRRRIEKTIEDPATRAAVVPNYPLGCKRVLISNDYYPALNRPNVTLVTDPLTAELKDGLQTDPQHYELDVVIYATGFDPLAIGALKVRGREGQELSERWQRSPRAHLGMTVPGFPNFYILLGPNTGLGHNSVMWMVECQVRYVMSCLRAQRRRNLRSLEAREEALQAFTRRVERRMQDKVWSECHSWYRRDDGLIFALWPSTTVRYWWETLRPRLSEYHCLPREQRVPS